MPKKLIATMVIALGIGAIGCAKRADNNGGMGAGADTTGLRDTTQTMTPAPADTTKPPQ